jgi:hypothetical protein
MEAREGVCMNKKGLVPAGLVALALLCGIGVTGCPTGAEARPAKSIKITNASLFDWSSIPGSAYLWVCSGRYSLFSSVTIYALAQFPQTVAGTVTLALKYPSDSEADGYISDMDWLGDDDSRDSFHKDYPLKIILIPLVDGAFVEQDALIYPSSVSFSDDSPSVTLDLTAFEPVFPKGK